MLCVAKRFEMWGVVEFEEGGQEAGGSGVIGLCINVAGVCVTGRSWFMLDEVEG